MKINIKTTNISLDEPLRIWVEKKLGEMDRFLGSFGSDGLDDPKHKEKVELWVDIGRTSQHHQKGDVFRAEVQMHLPNKSLRAEAIHEDLRVAINIVKEELEIEVKKYKGRRISRARTWARKTKEWVRGSETFLDEQRIKVLNILGIKKK